jgi:hypothetical protein
MDELQIPALSGHELEHAFLSAINVPLLGLSEGPFAAYDFENKKLLVFGAVHGSVEATSFDDDYSLMPLELAKRNGASFHVDGELVFCEMGSVRASGRSYSEAAMRALVAKLKPVKTK